MQKLLFFFLLLLLLACRKETFTDNPGLLLETSTDTLRFDTVFTTTGSVTGLFKITNHNNQGIRIGSVRLAGGAASPFKINVNGTPGPEVKDVEVAAGDSAYVFATVSINPTATNLPFVVRDSVEINYNGNKNWVQLEAYGQNAHFFRNKIIRNNETWNADLPYVILGGLVVDTNATLTVTKGCRIYLHADAPFIVHGTLQTQGEQWDSTRIVFTGDRLDEPYRNFPASYPGLFFTASSRNNVLNYTVVKNAYQAVVVIEPSPTAGPKLTLNETIIDNAYDAGLLGLNTTVTARNLLVSNCGKNILLLNGGTYDFTHCTAVSFSNAFLPHKDPVLLVSNYLNEASAPNNLSALFRNCIFWGDSSTLVPNEVAVTKKGNTAFSVTFDRVLWRVKEAPANAILYGVLNNQHPQFDSVNAAKRYFDFRLKETSPAVNKGVNAGVPVDLDGKSRPVGLPDLGAFERR